MGTHANAGEKNFTAAAKQAFLLLYARFLDAPGEGQEQGIEITAFACCFDPLLCPAINRVHLNPPAEGEGVNGPKAERSGFQRYSEATGCSRWSIHDALAVAG
jgi:hypothetical protein